jgi:hypothetical protein
MQFTLRQLLAAVTAFAVLLSVAVTPPLLCGVLAGCVVAIVIYLVTTPAIVLMPPDLQEKETESDRIRAYCSLRRIGAILLGLLVGIVVGVTVYSNMQGNPARGIGRFASPSLLSSAEPRKMEEILGVHT